MTSLQLCWFSYNSCLLCCRHGAYLIVIGCSEFQLYDETLFMMQCSIKSRAWVKPICLDDLHSVFLTTVWCYMVQSVAMILYLACWIYLYCLGECMRQQVHIELLLPVQSLGLGWQCTVNGLLFAVSCNRYCIFFMTDALDFVRQLHPCLAIIDKHYPRELILFNVNFYMVWKNLSNSSEHCLLRTGPQSEWNSERGDGSRHRVQGAPSCFPGRSTERLPL